MEEHVVLKSIETLIVLVILVAAHFIMRHYVRAFLKKFRFTQQRRKLTVRIINLMLSITALVFISAIWGVNQSDMVVFVSSVLAVLGIAFVAQWSLLSNVTAGLVLFFNHPLKIGDHIKILEKDFIIEGKVDDITFFFVHLKTEKKEKITMSNSIILQKTILVSSESHPPVE